MLSPAQAGQPRASLAQASRPPIHWSARLRSPADRVRATFAAIKPPPPVDLEAWAVSNIVFGTESPPQFRGPYNPAKFPQFRRILEVASPDHVAEFVALMKSAQIGGTVLAQILLAGNMDIDPGYQLYCQATEQNAERFVKQKWRPMDKRLAEHRRQRGLRPIFAPPRSRDAASSLFYQEHAEGQGGLTFGGANSSASLSMITVPRMVLDDLTKWQSNPEGDPEAQAEERAGAFEGFRKIFKVSTAGLEHNCRINRAFKRGTQERWHVPCRACGVYQALGWDNFRGVIEVEGADPDAAHFTCGDCGKRIEERDLEWMTARGTWRADNPHGEYPSFHLWAAQMPFQSWPSIARKWLAARGNVKLEQTFYNDTLGLPYAQASTAPAWEDLQKRGDATGHPIGTVPPGGLILTAAIDVQDNRLEWAVWAFGRGRRRWLVDHGVIEATIDTEAGRRAADKLLARTWPDTFGNWRGLDQLAIDAGGHYQQEVVSWAKRQSPFRVMVVRGSRFDNAPPIARRKSDEMTFKGRVVKTGLHPWWVGVSLMKGDFYTDLRKADVHERGFVGFAQGLGADFYQQITSEERRKITNKRTGYDEHRWVKQPGQRNEMLDCAMYAEAAAVRCQWARRGDAEWDVLQAQRETPPAPAQAELFAVGLNLPPSAAPAGEVVAADRDMPSADGPEPAGDDTDAATPAVQGGVGGGAAEAGAIDAVAGSADGGSKPPVAQPSASAAPSPSAGAPRAPATPEVPPDMPATPAPTVPVMGVRYARPRRMIRGRFQGF